MLQPIQLTLQYLQQLTQNTQQSATYTTGFSKYNVSSLEFDTSYALLMDEELFKYLLQHD